MIDIQENGRGLGDRRAEFYGVEKSGQTGFMLGKGESMGVLEGRDLLST